MNTEFDEKKYLIVRNFFSLKDTERMARRMKLLADKNLLTVDDQCALSYSVYSDPIHAEMQEMYRYKLQSILDLEVFPTYTYSRIYMPKEVLEKHKDRPSCEISITSTLEYDTFDDKPWELFIENSEALLLYPGDALIYKGCEAEHWREKFIGVFQSQVFMHYVNKNGKYHEYKYDFRPSLGSSVLTKNTEQERICNERYIQKRTI
jgi:hypothetical protein